MAENSGIEWTDHTFNPWSGCTKVSPACDNCYAEALAKRSPRTFGSWQPGGARKRTSDAYWKQPLSWDRKACLAGKPTRVFCASMADVFDNQVPDEWRRNLWRLIWCTPNLRWLLLTKRPQNIARMLPNEDSTTPYPSWGDGWPNVWLGATVENQAEADRRILHLLRVPAKLRFLSCEPLLGPLNLAPYLDMGEPLAGSRRFARALHWVIAGGESGPKARPMHPNWVRSLRDQCQAAGVPFFFKQWGGWCPDETLPGRLAWLSPDGTLVSGGIAEVHQAACAKPCRLMNQVGKRAAGALLDGREWREVPR